jgi:DNA-directed RNA polymerase beta' subunit
MKNLQNSQYCHIGLVSSEEIKKWAERILPNGDVVGCVTQPHTIDYQTHKPERNGLFCERIFGPIKSYVCFCKKYQSGTKIEESPKFCEECGVELTESRVRRHRMGYINLECLVTHPWYLKQRPNYIARLLNQPSKYINSLVYYDTCLVRAGIDKPKLLLFITDQSSVPKHQGQIMFDTPLELFSFDHDWQRKLETFFSPKWFRILQNREIITGGNAIAKLLTELNLENSIKDCWEKCKSLAKSKTDKTNEDDILDHSLDILFKRISLLKSILNAFVLPEWMVMSCLPVLPPALRPMIELKEGQFITSDLNSLYQIIIYRNNRLSWVKKTGSPDLVLNMQKRLLQQGVDALFANGVGATPLTDKNWRPYKSLSDIIKGKKGRFRENLLGKRVDYSGRSVIVVGPSLSLNQCGLPIEMALELFQPFIVRKLIIAGLARNLRGAKHMIVKKMSAVFKVLNIVIQEHLVILNRAPTLHRLGMQAFQPILVKGRAIHLHPLVCTGFNADFDGDQMAVHVPLSVQSQAESRVLMLPFLNLLSPATGEALTVPSQDMLLGLYILTLNKNSIHNLNYCYDDQCFLNKFNKTKIFSFQKFSDVMIEYYQQMFHYQSRIWFRLSPNAWIINNQLSEHPIEIQCNSSLNGIRLNVYPQFKIRNDKIKDISSIYIRTTIGRILFNQQIDQAIESANIHLLNLY